MKFTDRFISVPTQVFDTREKELTNKENRVDTTTRINPFDISHFCETDDEGEDEFKFTALVMKSGISMTVYLSVNEFERLLNEWDKKTSL